MPLPSTQTPEGRTCGRPSPVGPPSPSDRPPRGCPQRSRQHRRRVPLCLVELALRQEQGVGEICTVQLGSAPRRSAWASPAPRRSTPIRSAPRNPLMSGPVRWLDRIDSLNEPSRSSAPLQAASARASSSPAATNVSRSISSKDAISTSRSGRSGHRSTASERNQRTWWSRRIDPNTRNMGSAVAGDRRQSCPA